MSVMHEVSVRRLIMACSHLERIEVLGKEWSGKKSGPDFNQPVPQALKTNLARTYSLLAESAQSLNASVTVIASKRHATKLRSKKPVTFSDIMSMNADIQSRLYDEFDTTVLHSMPRSAAEMYSPKLPLFGELVDQRIAAAAGDISEAGKCFAVGRYTACAFHLMRAMECAVQSLSSALDIGNVEREWGKLLSDIAKIVEEMPRGPRRDEWSEVHANLYHVKQAWRNSTMHPKRTYTEEEASSLFEAMKTLMQQIAKLLPDVTRDNDGNKK